MADLNHISPAFDHRQERAEQVEFLLMRMELLRPRDRVLLEAYLKGNVSIRQLSWLCGLSEQTVARQVGNLTSRLLGGDYITIMRYRGRFTGTELNVAYDKYLLGMGYRRIAVKRGISPARARALVKYLRHFISGHL